MHIARRIKSANAGTILNDLNTYYSVGNNKFQLQSFDHRNLDNKDAPLEVDYDFIIPDYVKVIGDEVYVNMQLSRTLENDLVEKSREQPIERDYKVQWENIVELDIPEGYSVSYLPAKSAFNNEEFSFEINYSIESSVVRSVTSIQIDQLMLEPGQFEAWNDMIKALSKSYRELIVLKKNQP
jgi:hypothetical protein